jgi:hypothetical protein
MIKPKQHLTERLVDGRRLPVDTPVVEDERVREDGDVGMGGGVVVQHEVGNPDVRDGNVQGGDPSVPAGVPAELYNK